MKTALQFNKYNLKGERMNPTKRLFTLLLAVAVLISGATFGLAVEKKSGNPSQTTDSKVNINAGTVEQLKTLPGVGPVTAQKIIDHRTKNGPFKKTEDLMSVKGIGQKKFSVLKDRITI